MENFNWSAGIENYVEELSSDNSVPGGGSAAAAAGAFGCALALMAINTTLKLKSTKEEIKPALLNNAGEIKKSLEKLKRLITEDSAAYKKYIETKKAAKTDPSVPLGPVLKEIAVLPADCALECMEVLKCIKRIKSGISPIIASDANCAVHMLVCCLKCCAENMKINLPFVKDDAVARLLTQTIEESAKAAAEAV